MGETEFPILSDPNHEWASENESDSDSENKSDGENKSENLFVCSATPLKFLSFQNGRVHQF